MFTVKNGLGRGQSPGLHRISSKKYDGRVLLDGEECQWAKVGFFFLHEKPLFSFINRDVLHYLSLVVGLGKLTSAHAVQSVTLKCITGGRFYDTFNRHIFKCMSSQRPSPALRTVLQTLPEAMFSICNPSQPDVNIGPREKGEKERQESLMPLALDGFQFPVLSPVTVCPWDPRMTPLS